jgi:hypothetical protein
VSKFESTVLAAGVVEKPQRSQLADEFLVDAGLGGEVERVQTGCGWQTSEPCRLPAGSLRLADHGLDVE